MPRNVTIDIFAEPRHQVVLAGGSFKTLLQRPRQQSGCSKGENSNGVIVIRFSIFKTKGGADGVIVLLFCLLIVLFVVVVVAVVVAVFFHQCHAALCM